MKIEVITQFYNDAFLAPFFMNHYSFADNVRVIIDLDTTDNTQEIVMKYPNATVDHFQFPSLYEDERLTDYWNKCYAESTADWVIGASSDEFVFLDNAHEYLSKQDYDIILVRLYQVYRNESESDLDPSIPIRYQRRCGDPNHVKGQNRKGTKPIVVRTGRRMRWMPGTHKIWNSNKLTTSPDILTGVHWHMADPCFCVDRRLQRQERMSPSDLAKGHGIHNTGVTRQGLLNECLEHTHDQRIF